MPEISMITLLKYKLKIILMVCVLVNGMMIKIVKICTQKPCVCPMVKICSSKYQFDESTCECGCKRGEKCRKPN